MEPGTNYTIHVQAVGGITPEEILLGDIAEEVLRQTDNNNIPPADNTQGGTDLDIGWIVGIIVASVAIILAIVGVSVMSVLYVRQRQHHIEAHERLE